MKCSACRLAAGAALLALSVVACGTTGTSGTGTGGATPRAIASGPVGNGVAKMPAGQAARAALAALTAASSVHVRGTFTADRRGERFDMRFEGHSASGSFTFKGAPVQTVTYGGSMYMKAGTDGWTAMGNPRNTAAMMAGRWFKVGPGSAQRMSPLSLSFFTAELAAHAKAAQATIRRGTLAGRQVVIITYQDGSKLYVATTGPAYPLRFDVAGDTGGQRDFSDYGTAFHIVAPTDAIVP